MVVVLRIFLIVFGCTSCTSIPKNVANLNSSHRQAIYVQTQGIYGQLSMWEKDKHWRKILNARVVIGRNGLAAVGAKKEGDGKTPQGTFALNRSFGYDAHINSTFPYTQLTLEDKWVDDPESFDYNQWVKTTTAKSFEILRRDDHLYSKAVVIEYNTKPIIPGLGSAIFMHLWRHYYTPTAGCVAMSSRNMRKTLKALDETKQPVIILNAQQRE